MKKKELENWLQIWFETGADMVEVLKEEVKVGCMYRGFYPDGRQFVYECTEIEDGDCIGNGYVGYEYGAGDIFCTTRDVVEKISGKKFKELTTNPLEQLGYAHFADDWDIAHALLKQKGFILKHKTIKNLMIEVNKAFESSASKDFDKVVVYKGESNFDIDHIFLSVVVEGEDHLLSILEAIDIESQI